MFPVVRLNFPQQVVCKFMVSPLNGWYSTIPCEDRYCPTYFHTHLSPSQPWTHPMGREVKTNDLSVEVIPVRLLSILVDKLSLDELGEGFGLPWKASSRWVLHHNVPSIGSDQRSILPTDKHQGWDSWHFELLWQVTLKKVKQTDTKNVIQVLTRQM